MSESQLRFDTWRTSEFFDEQTRAELASLTDPEEIEDRFGPDLEFGTAGLRGVMAAGPNRMNIYTVRRATKALAAWLSESQGPAASRGVVIAYDSRNNSARFAKETALTLCAEKIPAYLFPVPMPTPVLSFSVQHLGCAAGVVITASHNPKEYNGYKVYDRDGCQLLPRQAEAVLRHMKDIKCTDVTPMPERDALSSGLLRAVDPYVLDAFLTAAAAQSHSLPENAKQALRVVYSPLHGAGNIPVRRLLSEQGYPNVFVVPEQEMPDGDFPTVRVPNPEDNSALALGIRQAGENNADIVIATDPDCDRVAIAVDNNGFFQIISGNQLGALLTNYLLERRVDRLNSSTTLVKTIVTGELGAAIARSYDVKVVEVLTGFKYIGDQIRRYVTSPDNEFLIGYEESCGYLVGTHARDKDAVGACLLICEMAAYYKSQRQTLIDVLAGLYQQYGYHASTLDSYSIPGLDWKAKVEKSMRSLRAQGENLTSDVTEFIDYSLGVDQLPKTDMLKFLFADGSWMAVRPSGTEPKLKIYHSTCQSDRNAADMSISAHRDAIAPYLPEGAV